MPKILQGVPQQYVNHELHDVQAAFKKGRGTRGQIANICWIMEKAREFQKNIYFCFINYAKAFYIHTYLYILKKIEILLSTALSQHHLSGFEIAQLEFHHLH